MKQLTIVTGSLPPDACGCGDYAQALSLALERKGVRTKMFFRREWTFRKLFPYLREIRRSKATVVNIQYPTQGYGWSVVPPLLCILLRGLKRVVTLHEFSQKRIEAKIAIFLFFVSADWVVFTTEFERTAAYHVAPWLKSKSSVIPIGSNIPFREAKQSDIDIVYFGLIHPAKGLEEFAETVSCLSNRKELRIRVIGQIALDYEVYATEILSRLESFGIEVVLNRSSEDVSEMLSRTRIALLPFPDGMSRRRSSALAAMGNGALLVTSAAQAEAELFTGICVMPTHGSSLCELLQDVLNNFGAYNSIRGAGQAYARANSWSSVADSYICVLDDLAIDDWQSA